MITQNRYDLQGDMSYQGLSTDTKPTEDVAVNSLFLELDTCDFYYFDGSDWVKVDGGGGGGEAVLIDKNISANGTYNASTDNADGYKKVVVSVPNPSTGSISITSNNTYDVTNYASAVVNVPQGITPTGTISITTNGTVDVTNYASADVSVSGGGSISVEWATSVEIITIGANSVTNTQGVADYFTSAGYSFNLCILLDEFTVNNQFVWSANHTKNIPQTIVRWRNNGLNSASINAGYDCFLVEGTRYLLIGY